MLTLSFVDAHQWRLQKKRALHRNDFWGLEILTSCPRCRLTRSDVLSLHHATLTEAPQLGGPHIPYPTGMILGLPNDKDLPAARHGREDAGGQPLDDEAAIFSLDRIRREINRLDARICVTAREQPEPEMESERKD